MSQNHTTPSAAYSSVKAMSEVSTVLADTTVDTPSVVSSMTWSTGLAGLGCTTHGWRPISVKIQPKLEARKGIGSATRHSRENQVESVTLPLRSSHRPATARAAEKTPSPIISRKLQNVMNRLG